ncbi:TIGR04255 family protein [Rudaea sp.]|uniref:TIGR04255 family protein n=1 Tax=Rudaea sp. TaxID=2136325 RepID=UPI003783821C
MNETLQNAPLVEIVAEIRWPVSQSDGAVVLPAGQNFSLPLVDLNKIEPFFRQVSAAVAKLGFDKPERLGMTDFPILPSNQVVYRYRRADGKPVLMQVGPGIFTVNALPPYESWAQFQPWLDKGVDALLEALLENPGGLTIGLRYIDAFRQNLTDGRNANRFATEVLGFRFDLPKSLRSHAASDDVVRAALQVGMPVDGMQMGVSLSDGKFSDDKAVLMSTDIRADAELPAEKAAIVSALNKAHELAHETFMGMTESIRDKLRPAASEGNG